MINFDAKATEIVRNYIIEHLDKSDPMPDFTVFTVWKCKALQNWKYLLSSTLFDGMYYELTYNGDKKEWYLDAYMWCLSEETINNFNKKVSEYGSERGRKWLT